MSNYCTNCGTKLDENKKCPNCKNILTSVSVKEEKEAKKYGIIATIFPLVVFILYILNIKYQNKYLEIIKPIFLIGSVIFIFYTLGKFKNIKSEIIFPALLKFYLTTILVWILLWPVYLIACTDFCRAME